MIEPITYTLRKGENNSDQFYKDLEVYTNQVLIHAESNAKCLVKDYQSYIKATALEKVRSWEEYSFELLVMGVLWNTYSEAALNASIIPENILTKLVYLRNHSVILKPFFDYIRGVLGTLFLLTKKKSKSMSINLTLKNMNKLMLWLGATGEFKQELKRLINWLDFFSVLPYEKVVENLTIAIEFAEWFETSSENSLGSYTDNIEMYLIKGYPKHRWHEDVIFCGRKRDEYHLNMVGAEIMNRAFREEFLFVKNKVVLLPACMKTYSDSRCIAQNTDSGLHCLGCTPGCRVNELTRLGEKNSFEVFVIPHESTAFTRWTRKPAEAGEVGIIGIACVLNLIEGGWRSKNLDIPPQCVFLDYCGCSNHWLNKGVSTDINIPQLKRILEIRDEILK